VKRANPFVPGPRRVARPRREKFRRLEVLDERPKKRYLSVSRSAWQQI
jgi:hypothetical protein